MKRLFQIAALLVVTLLFAEPMLAAAPCAMSAGGGAGCASCCQKALAAMGPNCPMHKQTASGMRATGCTEGCCEQSMPRQTQWTADPTKVAKIAAVVVEPVFFALPVVEFVVRETGPPPGRSAAIYILNQVFRI